jgi:hypothetical protein
VVSAKLARIPQSPYPGAVLGWAKRDTRWDVYPSEQPAVLAVHDYEGWWLPVPAGHSTTNARRDEQGTHWFKSPSGYYFSDAAPAHPLCGAWMADNRYPRCVEFVKAGTAPPWFSEVQS